MNWEAIGAVGEIFGAGAVVLSLIYLGVQIRNQNREARAAAMHEVAQGFRDIVLPYVDPDFAQVFVRANEDFDALSEAERVQIISAGQRMLRLWEEAYYQHAAGRLDERLWHSIVRQYSAYLSVASLIRVWALRRDFYTEGFSEFVDSVQKRAFVTK